MFPYNSGHRISFEHAFDDLWLGDVDDDDDLDFVLAGDNAVRLAPASDSTYGFPLTVLASSEHQVLGGKPFHHVAVTDLVGDALPDVLYVAGGAGTPFEIGVAEQTSSQTFAVVDSVVEPAASTASSQPLRVADVDGRPDVIGTTSRLFVRSSRYATTVFLDGPVGAIATGDLDADGTADAIHVTADKTAVRRVRIGTLGGQPTLVSEPLLSEGGDLIEAADLDDDQRAEVILIRDAKQPTSKLVVRPGSTL